MSSSYYSSSSSSSSSCFFPVPLCALLTWFVLLFCAHDHLSPPLNSVASHGSFICLLAFHSTDPPPPHLYRENTPLAPPQRKKENNNNNNNNNNNSPCSPSCVFS